VLMVVRVAAAEGAACCGDVTLVLVGATGERTPARGLLVVEAMCLSRGREGIDLHTRLQGTGDGRQRLLGRKGMRERSERR
jgi:hypothetical protein